MTITSRNSIETFQINGFYEGTKELQRQLEDISRPGYRSSTIEKYKFHLWNTVITRRKLNLLVQILNTPLPNSPTRNNATGLNKWCEIHLCLCTFAKQQPDTNHAMTAHVIADSEGYCSLEDRAVLASTLAQRSDRLLLTLCPEILDCLVNIPRLEVSEWDIEQGELSSLQCTTVGDLIRSSVHMNWLSLKTNYLADTRVLAQSFSNAIHLPHVLLETYNQDGHQQEPGQERLSDVVLRDGWNGIVGRLVQRRLNILCLSEMHIEDSHFIMIAHMLPTSQLESLWLFGNKIGLQGILEFARQLPRIKCLKDLRLGSRSPWEHVPEQREEGYAALLQGMLENDSLESLDISCAHEGIVYYTDLNRAGRRILATSSSVPLGLWPLVLERAGHGWRYIAQANKASAQSIYFFLQSDPLQSILTNLSGRDTLKRKRDS